MQLQRQCIDGNITEADGTAHAAQGGQTRLQPSHSHTGKGFTKFTIMDTSHTRTQPWAQRWIATVQRLQPSRAEAVHTVLIRAPSCSSPLISLMLKINPAGCGLMPGSLYMPALRLTYSHPMIPLKRFTQYLFPMVL